MENTQNNAITKLPENWNEMQFYEQIMWFTDNFGTDEDDDDGYLIYDTERMTPEILEAYKDVIGYQKESRKNGVFID